MADRQPSPGESFHVHPHIGGLRLYLGIFGALIALTALTIFVSYVHLGAWNLLIAVVIATAKATLVVLFFMHLKWDVRFHALVFVSSLLFGGLFLVYTVNDTAYRTSVEREAGARYSLRTGRWAGGLPEGIGEPILPVGEDAPGIEPPVMPREGTTVIEIDQEREVTPKRQDVPPDEAAEGPHGIHDTTGPAEDVLNEPIDVDEDE